MQHQTTYYRTVPVSEKPKDDTYAVLSADAPEHGIWRTFIAEGIWCYQSEYPRHTHYLQPIPMPDAERLRKALEKILKQYSNGLLAYSWLRSVCEEALSAVGDGCRVDRPKVICYCGSIRVALDAFKKAEYDCLMRGDIALLPCCMFVDIEREYGANSHYKVMADEQHKCKIDLCDEVFILNVGGYIGESTRREIEYATIIGKPIVYLEPLPPQPINK